jgi:hypothetical protein
MSNISKEIDKDLSLRYNLPLSVVEAATISPYQFIRMIMKKGEFESVRVTHLGYFGVKPKRLEYMREKLAEINDRQK